MRLSDLRGAKVRTLDGETLGRVHEVHCEARRITAIVVGASGLIEMLTAKKSGKEIPWECVRKIHHKEIIVALGPGQARR